MLCLTTLINKMFIWFNILPKYHAMRAILTALMLTIASQAGAECGNLCDYDWWKSATEADVRAELDVE